MTRPLSEPQCPPLDNGGDAHPLAGHARLACDAAARSTERVLQLPRTAGRPGARNPQGARRRQVLPEALRTDGRPSLPGRPSRAGAPSEGEAARTRPAVPGARKTEAIVTLYGPRDGCRARHPRSGEPARLLPTPLGLRLLSADCVPRSACTALPARCSEEKARHRVRPRSPAFSAGRAREPICQVALCRAPPPSLGRAGTLPAAPTTPLTATFPKQRLEG